MNILAVSDEEQGIIYSPNISWRFRHIDLAIGCGDLSYNYLEYIISMLDIPLYYVRGNHAPNVEIGHEHERREPWGAIDLHKRVICEPSSGLLMAGIEGSLRYNYGPHQYSQLEMWFNAFSLVPGLILNRLRYGRYLDLLVTHAPPWKIHDQDDLPHQGAHAFNWLIKVFQPLFHLHGHIHIYRADAIRDTLIGQTMVTNTFGFREVKIDIAPLRKRALARRFARKKEKEI